MTNQENIKVRYRVRVKITVGFCQRFRGAIVRVMKKTFGISLASRVRSRFRGSPRFWIRVRVMGSQGQGFDGISSLVEVQSRPDEPANMPS